MKLLKLVIVDDEPILLQGLLKTYDWAAMGFEVVGTAQSGEQAIEVIKAEKPHVVLTDIRMKKVTGLMVIEEIKKAGLDTLFIVLSAYRDFSYAQQACELGAFAYLLKPIEDDKLQETMESAYRTCMQQLDSVEKLESWEKMVKNESEGFLQVIVQKYLQNRISHEKLEKVFRTVDDVIFSGDRFIAICVDVDLMYKITNPLDYESAKFSLTQYLTKVIGGQYFHWNFESEEGYHVFLIKTDNNGTVKELKQILEEAKKEKESLIIASMSKPYKGIEGIRRSYEEARKLLELAGASGASVFTMPEEVKDVKERTQQNYSQDSELLIVNAVRKNEKDELKEAFVHFIYSLPGDEELQCQYMHKIMLRVEFEIKDSYGMTDNIKEQFRNYYSNLQNLSAAKAVNVCYQILCSAIEERKQCASKDDVKYFKEYMSTAVAYIEEHLDDEDLSIVSVATHVYLNSVYFGRVFKNTFHMTFKQYLLQRRMERAKELLENGTGSIGSVCEQVGISNQSYFSHLFKEYTGKLPSEYKREFEKGLR